MPVLPDSVWPMVPLETYKVMLIEAKEKHDYVLSESHNITDRCMKMLILMYGLTAFILKEFRFTSREAIFAGILYGLVLAFVTWRIITTVLNPREVHAKGTMVEKMMEPHAEIFVPTFSDDKMQKAFYYSLLVKYQKKIAPTDAQNVKRQNAFTTGLLCSFFLVVCAAIIFVTGSSPGPQS